jgi:hypothetical protein
MKLSTFSSLFLLVALGTLLASSNLAQPNKQPAQKRMLAKVPVPTKAQMQKVFPDASGDLFQRGQQITVFWIERSAIPQGQSSFHGYHIRGEHKVTTLGLQERLKSGIEEAIATDPGFGATCFHPVHGLRVSDGNQSVDMIICFGCGRFAVFSGESEREGTLGKSGDTEFLLNRVLRGSIQ